LFLSILINYIRKKSRIYFCISRTRPGDTQTKKAYPCLPPPIMMAYVGHGGIEVLKSCLHSQVSVSRQTFKQFI